MDLPKTLLAAAAAIWIAVFTLPDNNLHVVICDVGQGDAILVSLGTNQMLLDGGPDNSVLGCLSRHMPFYDRQIEVMLMTHPQADHLTGLIDVSKRYSVLRFIRSDVTNSALGFRDLINATGHIPTHFATAGEEIKISNLKFLVVWPTAEFVTQNKDQAQDLNDFAVSGDLNFGKFDMLLTADADSRIELAEMATGLLKEIDVLKVPHHGSKTGMLPKWLELISPKLAVISVGKKNRYGHPHQDALDLLKSHNIKILRTDQSGDVEIVSDGRKWWYNLQYGGR